MQLKLKAFVNDCAKSEGTKGDCRELTGLVITNHLEILGDAKTRSDITKS